MKLQRFGELPGVPEGRMFKTRIELSLAGVHGPRRSGIGGSADEGAVSIVSSGAYEDDEDHGDVIIYTGQGGRSTQTGQQVADQQLAGQNQALARSAQRELPVRVIRGADPDNPYSPPEGYRYEGLYRVTCYWQEPGRSGHLVWRFRLDRIVA